MQSGFSIFDYIFFPTELIQKGSLNVESLKPKKTSELEQGSGYAIKQSFYIQLIKFFQIVIIGSLCSLLSGFF